MVVRFLIVQPTVGQLEDVAANILGVKCPMGQLENKTQQQFLGDKLNIGS